MSGQLLKRPIDETRKRAAKLAATRAMLAHPIIVPAHDEAWGLLALGAMRVGARKRKRKQ